MSVGQIGVHHPREIIRIERDYTGGEVVQFAPIYPLELEGRVSPHICLPVLGLFSSVFLFSLPLIVLHLT